MKKLRLIFTIFICKMAMAQTTIPGGLVYGNWTLSGSPYNVMGSIQIPNDSTLTIQPGVQVIFQGTFKLNVQGRLLAIGTITDTIFFTTTNTTNGWRGIQFSSTAVTNDSSKLFYCKLEYGKATGASPFDCGGAFYFKNFSKTIISNSRISNCLANFNGAAIFCDGSSPVITKNTISGNTAGCYDSNTFSYSGGGGGIYCNSFSSPTISNNIISNNSATNSGGGRGAGIYSDGSPIISNNTILNNTAGLNGGGICCFSSAGGLISGNIISNNTCAVMGGGISCGSINNPTFTKNFISNNSAVDGGGFFLTASSLPAISNNVICNNTASNNGGGFYCESSNNPTIINSTIANNTAINGGALYCKQTSSPTFRNCILWGNTATTSGTQVFLNDEPSDPNFYFCDVEGGSATFDLNGNFYIGTYTNNINANPNFVSPSGGSGTGFNGITSDWSLQAGSPCIDVGDPTTVSPVSDIAGNPRVTVCRVDMGAYEYQSGPPFLSSIIQSKQILCNGTNTGQLVAVPSGGNTPYTFSWNGGSTNDTLFNVGAGSYTCTVGNSLGCSRIVTFTVSAPPAMSLNTSKTNINCSGSCVGSATVTASGGTTPYKYQWTSGINDTLSFTPQTLCTGPYTVTVKDGLGCIGTASVNIATPSALSFTVAVVNVSCFGYNNGSITVNATGGSNPLQYSINNGVNYQLSSNFTGLASGSYSVITKDNNGCQASVAIVSVSAPPLLSTSVTQTNIKCFGATNGSATVTTNGGTPTYTYSWSPVGGTAAVANNLAGGNYTVTVTDSKNCIASSTFTIISTNAQPTICMVTADSVSLHNIIYWDKSLYSNVDSFIVYRLDVGSSTYFKIGATSKDSLSLLIDTARNIGGPNGGHPQYSSWRYKIAILDSCGNISAKSPYHETSFLQDQQNSNFNWNAYTVETGQTNPVTGYGFSRDDNNTGTYIVLVNTAGLSTTDPNYFTFQTTANWRVDALGFNCTPTMRYGNTGTQGAVVQSRSNVRNNRQIGINTFKTGSIAIYPNPNDGIFNIQTGITLENGSIEIYNVLGEKVYTALIQNQNTQLDISTLSNGIYEVRALNNNTVICQTKVVKQ